MHKLALVSLSALAMAELAHRGHEWAGNLAADGQSYRLLIRCGA